MVLKYFFNKWHEGAESLFASYSEQWEKRKQCIDKIYSNKGHFCNYNENWNHLIKNILHDASLEHIN